MNCSEDLVLVWPEDLVAKEVFVFDLATSIVHIGTSLSLLACRENAVEGFVHHRRSADPDTADVLGSKLVDLLKNEVLIPALRIDLFLREAHEELESVKILALAESVEGLEKFKGDRLTPPRERHVHMELEVVHIDIITRRQQTHIFGPVVDAAVPGADIEHVLCD